MFSNLGPLFKTRFRQAESNDTRQYIPHQERDQNRKKRDEEELGKAKEEAWTDDTSVSIFALRSFLIDFLKTMPGGEDLHFATKSHEKIISSSRPKESARPTSTRNAKAVRAYQTMASHSSDEQPVPLNSEEKNSSKKEPSADQLESKELRDIHNLILDLESLEKKGLTELHILKASSFVESLKQAVLLEKSKF